MKNSINIEKILPFILAVLLPGMFFLNIYNKNEKFIAFDFVSIWLATSTLLLILWYLNVWLSKKFPSGSYFITIFFNIILISIFVFLIVKILPENVRITTALYWTIGFRLIFTALIFTIIQQSLKSAKTVAKLKLENESLKTEKYKAELDQLRKQINPHFLFNSLSTLRTMIRNSNPNSEKFVLNLSALYRQILQNRDKDYIALEEEFTLLNAYIFLLKDRYESALKIKIDINPASLQYSIPVFTLQLLVENCVKHNIVSAHKPLHINIFQKDEISVTVENNFQPIQENNNSTGVGLTNLLNRYRLTGIEQGVVVNQTNNLYSVTVKLF